MKWKNLKLYAKAQIKTKNYHTYNYKKVFDRSYWSNIPGIDTQYGVTYAYWLDYHKPIYCAFKLPNTLP
jgi:hypothetical protein